MTFRFHTRLLLCAAMISCIAFPAVAQIHTNGEVADRMDKLERDLMTIQRQLAREGVKVSLDNIGDEGNPASLEVRISAIEDEIRALRGKAEENEFQLRKANETLAKLQQDIDFRFNELKNATPAAPAPAPETPKAEAKPDKSADAEESDGGESSVKTTAGDGVLRMKPKGNPDDAEEEFNNPRDHYNYAFRLLNQSRYEEAATYFKQFTEKYQQDPLIGNAFYWLGETYYIRREYVQAADNFRAGFEALPNGPKAADNLLKLSMALSAMKKTKEACVVLDQLAVKFKETSSSVAQKAESERTRIGCK